MALMLAQRPPRLGEFGPDTQDPDHQRGGDQPTPGNPHTTIQAGQGDDRPPLPIRNPGESLPKRDEFADLKDDDYEDEPERGVPTPQPQGPTAPIVRTGVPRQGRIVISTGHRRTAVQKPQIGLALPPGNRPTNAQCPWCSTGCPVCSWRGKV